MSDILKAGAPVGNKNAAKQSAWFAKGHKEAYEFHKPKADYYASKSGIGDSDDLAKFHGERAEFHKKEFEKHSGGKSVSASSAPSAEVVRAAGNSEGAKKGWEHRAAASIVGDLKGEGFKHSGFNAKLGPAGSGTFSIETSRNYESESDHNSNVKHDWTHETGTHAKYFKEEHGATLAHQNVMSMGGNKYRHTFRVIGGEEKANASDGAESDIIHCRASSAAGAVLAADKAWNPGEPVDFMWMPAGVHTICAGFRNGSIELTVRCDENTASVVQSSLDQWRAERPKQEPFGCIEHREHEASVRVSAQQAFSFKDDGVYISAEPTVLGAQNVNGKVHRSWSPSFTTDADYSQAKTVKTSSGTVLVFPEGVRGSRSNPAEITGVDFCVGTLTNKPAFHAMSPVKSSEVADAVMAAGTSEGAKKGWVERLKGHYQQADLSRERASSAASFEDAHDHAINSSLNATQASSYALRLKDSESHDHAVQSHRSAQFAHELAADKLKPNQLGWRSYHKEQAQHHESWAAKHANWSDLANDDTPLSGSDAARGEGVKAHCRHTLLEEVPDATPEEIACYEKCIDGGGSHPTAVLEIKAKRDPQYHTESFKASDREDFEVVTASGTSEGAKKGWTHRVYVRMVNKHAIGSGSRSYPNQEIRKVRLTAGSDEEAEKKAHAYYKKLDYKNLHTIHIEHNTGQGDETTKASEAVQATWSDAARKAAAEARRNHLHEGFNEWHGSDQPTEKKHVEGLAWALANDDDAHKKFFSIRREGRGGSELPKHHSEDIHKSAKDWSGSDSPRDAAHVNAMHWAVSMSPELHSQFRAHVSDLKREMRESMGASDKTSPDTIAARQSEALDAANRIAAEKGVARTALDEVYEKVTGSGTSEGARKGAETKKLKPHEYAAARSRIENLSHGAHAASGHANSSGEKADHDYAAGQHEVAFYSQRSLAGKAGRKSDSEYHMKRAEGHKAQLEYHSELAGSKRTISASDESSASESDDLIHATWSDAARKAAAEARRLGSVASVKNTPGSRMEASSAHSAAADAFEAAADHLKDEGEKRFHLALAKEHRKHASNYDRMDETKASEQSLTLESIYARQGANR